MTHLPQFGESNVIRVELTEKTTREGEVASNNGGCSSGSLCMRRVCAISMRGKAAG